MRAAIIVFSVCLLSGCLNYDFNGQNIRQGNVLTEKKFSKLKLGMSKQEVLLIMGNNLNTPLLQQNRWDYVQTTQPANKSVAVKSISLYFQGERLSHIKKGVGKTS